MGKVLYKIAFLSMTLLLLCVPLCACAAEGPQEDETAQAWEADYAQYAGVGTRVRGGTAMEESNLKALACEREGEELCIRLSFVQGSRISGSESEAELLTLPAYAVYLLDAPYRLVIEMEGLAYWDYVRSGLGGSAARETAGFFHHAPAEGAGHASLYIQLRQEARFLVEEEGGVLVIRLFFPPEQETEDEDGVEDVIESGMRYYALSDMYREYCAGSFPAELEGMRPVRTQAEGPIVLISAPYDTPSEAERFMHYAQARSGEGFASRWYSAAVREGELPPYAAELAGAALEEQEVYRVGAEARGARPFIGDGFYLATLPEKNGVLYSKRVEETELTGDSYSYEQLYIMELDGTKKPLFAFPFETIESAAFSPDGRKLAVLERAAESAHLYVFDVAAKEMLVDLCEVGFGDMVSAYTWDALGVAIYAVSGTEGMRLHQYDFSVPDETKRHTLVDRYGVDEAGIAYGGGYLYFVESDMEKGARIHRVKPGGGVRRAFAVGSNFALSPDGRRMAISGTAEEMAGAAADTVRLLDMQSGESVLVTDAFPAYQFFFSRDGLRLYYFENRLSGGMGEGETAWEEGEAPASAEEAVQEDPYPYTLWMYDAQTGENRALMDLPSTRLYMSGLSEKLYLNFTDAETMGNIVRACYALDALPENPS